MDSEGDSGEDPDRKSIESLIDSLRRDSRFERIFLPDGRIELRASEGIPFYCVRLSRENSSLLSAIGHLFRRSFERQELDPSRILNDVVEDRNFDVYALEDSRGQLIGAAVAGYFQVPQKREYIVFVDNVAVDPLWRGKGLARELYRVICESAKQRADEERSAVRAILGEVKNDIEDFWNKLGWKRMYAHDEHGALKESPYLQPPLHWDQESGTPQKGYGAVIQHLMIWFAPRDRNFFTVQELFAMIEIIYKGNYLPDRSYFRSSEAYENCSSCLDALLAEIKKTFCQFSRDPVICLSRTEREEMDCETPLQIKPAL